MRHFLPAFSILLLVTLVGCDASLLTSPDEPDKCEPIRGKYNVVLVDKWDGEISEEVAEEVHEYIEEVLEDHGISDEVVTSRWEYALRGFSAELSDETVSNLENDPRVEYIEKDFRCSFILDT